MPRPLLVIALAVLVAAAYTGIWFRTAGQLEEIVTGQTWTSDGYDFTVESVSITGFPARLRAEARNVTITKSDREDKSGIQSLMTDVLVVDSLPYRLNHLIFDFPKPIIVTRRQAKGIETIVVTPEKAHASLIFEGRNKFRASIESSNVAISRAIGRAALRSYGTAKAAIAHTRPTADGEGAQDIYVAVTDFVPVAPGAKPLRQLLADLTIEQAADFLQATRNQSQRDALLQEWAANDGKLIVRQLNVVRGNSQFEADGKLRADADTGSIEGDVTVNITNYQQVLDEAAPQSENDAAFLVNTTLGLLDMMDGQTDGKVTAPLTAAEGGLWFGPVRLVDIPPLFQP